MVIFAKKPTQETAPDPGGKGGKSPNAKPLNVRPLDSLKSKRIADAPSAFFASHLFVVMVNLRTILIIDNQFGHNFDV
jgi:hypothetical protein